jgi:hypothetical protein
MRNSSVPGDLCLLAEHGLKVAVGGRRENLPGDPYMT